MTESGVLVTTVVRHADSSRRSGFLRLVDLETGRIRWRLGMPESAQRDHDPNPRGGLRGARGASIHGDRLVVANSERLLVFDGSWSLVGEITQPCFGGIHDILAEADGIWVTCTSADLLVKVSWSGEILADWEWRRDKTLREAIGLRSVPPVDRRLDYRDPEAMRTDVRNTVHLNGVARCPQGLLLSFGRVLSPRAYRAARRRSIVGKLASTLGLATRTTRPRSLDTPSRVAGSSAFIVLLEESGNTRILRRSEGIAIPLHNVAWINDKLIFNDSNAGALVATAGDDCADRSVPIPGSPSFARGLAHCGDEVFLVGSQAPLALYRVDLGTSTITATIPLHGQEHESVYAICPLPASFCRAPPPSTGLAEIAGAS